MSHNLDNNRSSYCNIAQKSPIKVAALIKLNMLNFDNYLFGQINRFVIILNAISSFKRANTRELKCKKAQFTASKEHKSQAFRIYLLY